MPHFQELLTTTKELFRPLAQNLPQASRQQAELVETLFDLQDACPTDQADFSALLSQLLMCLSEPIDAWSPELTTDFHRLLPQLLNHRPQASSDEELDQAPFVIFRGSDSSNQTAQVTHPAQAPNDLEQSFFEEAFSELSLVTEALFHYETDPSPEHLSEALTPLRQILASAQILEKPIISKLTQQIILLLEHSIATQHHWNDRGMTDINDLQDSLADILRLNQTGLSLTNESIRDILEKIRSLKQILPPKPPSTSGPSDEIIESFEIFRPQKKRIPEDSIEFLPDFIMEANQHLQSAEASLTEIFAEGSNPDRISTLFRAIHTIKGASGFLMLYQTERLTHAAEDYLSLLRDQQLPLVPQGQQLLFDVIVALQHNLNQLLETQEEFFPDIDQLSTQIADPELIQQAIAQKTTHTPSPTKASSEGSATKLDHLRVKLASMDRLLALVGELAMTNNKLHNCIQDQTSPELEAIWESLYAISRNLEHTLLEARLQPMSIAFRKLPRMVQELSKQSGKKIQIHIEGDHYELDKKILEAVQGPLLHLVRNAIDHGIEHPAERRMLGKDETGHLIIRVLQAEGQLVIEVQDDGRGIDGQGLLHKAIQQEFISIDAASKLSNRQILDLIYHPGLSIKTAATKLSGRGVGMDVVKEGVERIGGLIDLQSKVNEGTLFSLRIPLTLTVVSTLSLPFDGTHYLLPKHHLREVIDAKTADIVAIQDQLVLRHSSGDIPLTTLAQVLHLPPKASQYIVICAAGDRYFALGVPQITNFQEVITQPLNPQLQHISILDGASLLEDGQIALILNATAIADRFQIDFRPHIQSQAPTSDSQLFLEIWSPNRQAVPLSIVQSVSQLETAHPFPAGWSTFTRHNHPMRIFCPADMAHQDASVLVLCQADTREIYGIPVFQAGELLKAPIDSKQANSPLTIGPSQLPILRPSVPE